MNPEMTQFISKQKFNRTIVFFYFLLQFSLSYAESDILEQQIVIPDFSGTAKLLLDQIGVQEKIIFAYSSEVSLSYVVSFKQKQMPLKEFLNILFEGKPIGYKSKGKKVMLFPSKIVSNQSDKLSQTVRGTIIDADSKLPLQGVTVIISGSDPIIGTHSNEIGIFRLENIPIGRTTLQFSFIGYETMTMPNIEVNSGKEVVLDINMPESVVKLDEVVVKSTKKGEATNDMSMLSSHSFSVEETKR